MKLFITFLSVTFIIMKNSAVQRLWNRTITLQMWAQQPSSSILAYAISLLVLVAARITQSTLLNQSNYPELPCELTEKLTETAVRA